MMGISIFCMQSMENTDMQNHKTPHKPIKETQHVYNDTLYTSSQSNHLYVWITAATLNVIIMFKAHTQVSIHHHLNTPIVIMFSLQLQAVCAWMCYHIADLFVCFYTFLCNY